ncbi:MAG: hypothetical protein ABSG74_04715 [Candidatus Bathyarchaeia archaeon]|jgi:hypothetical protein
MNLKSVILIALCVLPLLTGISNGFAAPSFAATTKRAVFLSPLENTEPTWGFDAYKSLLKRAGYQVDILLDGNASISFFETGLAKYDLIVLRTDSMVSEGMTYFCAGDKADASARGTFAGEIALKEVLVGECVGFSILFLQSHYPAGSLRGLVIAVGSNTAQLSAGFLDAGAAALIGFNDEHCTQWGNLDSYSLKLLYYLSQGYSVEGANIELNIYLYMGHGTTADWILPYWAGDGSYKI